MFGLRWIRWRYCISCCGKTALCCLQKGLFLWLAAVLEYHHLFDWEFFFIVGGSSNLRAHPPLVFFCTHRLTLSINLPGLVG